VTSQLRIRGWLASRLPPEISAAYERAAERVKKPNARRTQKAYEVCPVESFRQWLGVRGLEAGPLFLPIARNGALEAERLSTRQCMRIITERCQAAGLQHVTSHSLRATFGTLAKDLPTSDVMAHAGWKSVAVAMGYQRQGALFDDSPTKGLLDE